MIAQAYLMNEPNWGNNFSVVYTWKTSIKNSVKGNGESRSAMYTWPRRSFLYNIDLSNAAEVSKFERNVYTNIHKVWTIPAWHEVTLSTSQASSGQPIIYCDTTYRNFKQGCLAAVIVDHETYFIGTILNFTDTYITFSENLTSTYPVGTVICPIVQCRLVDFANDINYKSSSYATVPVNFKETYEEDMFMDIGSHSYPSYNSFSVFNTEHNWSTDIKKSISKNVDFLEFLGASLADTYQLESNIVFSTGYNFYTREECWEVETFFNTQMGQWGNFWLPTWTKDIKVTSAFGTGDDTISIEDIEYSTYWDVNEIVGKTAVLIFPDNTFVYREIIDAPTSTSIQFDSTIGKSISASDLSNLVVSFLMPVRFNTDELKMDYITNSIANIKTQFITVHNEVMLPSYSPPS